MTSRRGAIEKLLHRVACAKGELLLTLAGRGDIGEGSLAGKWAHPSCAPA